MVFSLVAQPQKVKSICDVAFKNCYRLNSIILPQESLESIGCNVFEECKSLKTITIPKSVKSIGDDCFKNWTKNQTINFESKATYEANTNCLNGCNANVIFLDSKIVHKEKEKGRDL